MDSFTHFLFASKWKVDMPYKPYKIQKGVDAIELDTPHWKNPGQTRKTRQSTTVLGELWTEMNSAMKGYSPETQQGKQFDPRIRDKILSCKDAKVLQDMQHEMSCAIKGYLEIHNFKMEAKNEALIKRDRFCREHHDKLIKSKANPELAAAVLYQQCYTETERRNRNLAIELAWEVARGPLLSVFGGENKLVVNPESENSLYSHRGKK